VFEVHYDGRLDRTIGCQYMRSDVAVHTESVDPNELSYFELEVICQPYGYKSVYIYKVIGFCQPYGYKLRDLIFF
jgi:hypothetical protein